jgi:hypothetical protein
MYFVIQGLVKFCPSERPIEMQHHHAVVGEQFRAAAEESVIERGTDMFEHADPEGCGHTCRPRRDNPAAEICRARRFRHHR